jgi:predicted nucleotidyltransferase component of viral defense system
MSNNPQEPLWHEDPVRLRAALAYAERATGSNARLIEKDYFCSVVLRDLAGPFEAGLVFKGGTCLSRVHAEFFRLSEDLDFCLSVPAESAPGKRRAAAAPIRTHLSSVLDRLPCFRVAEVLQGHNGSRQYNGRLAYRSVVTGEDEFIKVEVSLREPVLLPADFLPARTMLFDPDSGMPAIPPVNVRVLSLREAYAEKIRAALTRREPAIRDFFDIDSAVQRGRFDLREREILDLVQRKLAVVTSASLDTSDGKVAVLRGQIEAQLRPVLRTEDYERFDLDRVIALLRGMRFAQEEKEKEDEEDEEGEEKEDAAL